MERRELLGLLGAGAAGIMTAGTAAARQDQAKAADQAHRDHGGHHLLEECGRTCNETIAHCLGQHEHGSGDQHHHKAVAAMIDCQAFCGMASALMARDSPMAAYAHHACAQACRDCAAVCDQGKDEAMRHCAEVCRRCEAFCKEHSGQTASANR